MLCSITLQAEDHSRLYQNLPVGVAQPAVANIPALTVSLTDFGAVGDGVTDCTEAFAKAISHLNKQGGGHLNVPAGIYLTGPVKMKSLIDLHVERGAIILFSPDKQRYVNNNGDQKAGSRATPPLTASKCHDISITGDGDITAKKIKCKKAHIAIAGEGDMVITMGAGDVTSIGPELLAYLQGASA